MKIIECQQLSPEWFQARRGIPTASSFDKILTPAKAQPSSSQDDYLCELIAERMALVPPADRPMNGAMRHGVEFEGEARNWYAFETGHDVQQVGFVLHDSGDFGCSPDGLVAIPGFKNLFPRGLELKCPQPKTHVKYLLDGGLPTEYRCQVHGCLIATGIPVWDFVSYCPGFPPLRVEVRPDEFTDKLAKALRDFVAKLHIAHAKLTREAA